MTQAPADTLSEIELFRHQAKTVHTVVGLNVDGFSHEESLREPPSGGNCLNWVLGHLLCIYEQTLEVLGQEPIVGADMLEQYARGAPPLDDASAAIPFDELLAAWDEASRRVNRGLKALTPEVLDEPAPYSPGGNPEETIRSLLTTVFFHQAYHAGQTGLLRRIAGKEGAIR